MPELPEVETIARDLHERLRGRTIRTVEVIRPDVLRGGTAGDLTEHSTGRSVLRVWRRGKTAVLTLEQGAHLLVQPRFTGALLVRDRPGTGDGSTASTAIDAPELDPFATIVWTLADGGAFWYRDVRRLGTVTMADDSALATYERRIGPEPLDPDFDAARLSGLLRGSRSAIKKVLMDQRYLAGVGNIYANEALWRAGIDPSRAARDITSGEAERLHAALTQVLSASIQSRGTTFRDYRDPSNRAGGFAAQLMAYGRGGEPCQRCGHRLSETHAIDGRSTVFCHRCQR